MNYSSIERQCFALLFATQKLHHCFLVHTLNLVPRSNLLKYLLLGPATSRRIVHCFSNSMKSILLLSLPGACKSQALSDLLTQFSFWECESLHKGLPLEEICSMETRKWCLSFDGSSSHKVVGQELSYMILMPPVFLYLSARGHLF